MKTILRIIVVFFVILIVVASVTSLAAQETPHPLGAGFRDDSPPYGVHGPYWVGVRELVIDPDSERPLAVTIWYPSLNTDGQVESIDYVVDRVNMLASLIPPDTLPIVSAGQALLNAAPNTMSGPYPVVVFSHGFMMWRHSSSFLTEHLASWGFVVIAPDHINEDPSGGVEAHWRNYVDRAHDVTRILDFAEAFGASDAAWVGMMDTQRAAVGGHSFGGWLALLEGGALINPLEWQSWCDAMPARYEFEEDCQAIAYLDRIAAQMGLDAVPQALWPPLNDPRVQAVINLAGPYWLFGAEGVSHVHTPILSLVGSADVVVSPLNSGPIDAYPHLGTPDKTLVVFENADHVVFVNGCDRLPSALSTVDFSWLCRDSVWEMPRVHDVTNHFATAFLLKHLYGDTVAAEALKAENVQFTGVRYQTEQKAGGVRQTGNQENPPTTDIYHMWSPDLTTMPCITPR